jgi:hypothetical protein
VSHPSHSSVTAITSQQELFSNFVLLNQVMSETVANKERIAQMKFRRETAYADRKRQQKEDKSNCF